MNTPVNLKRILLGGLAAGVLLNITEGFYNLVLAGKAMEAAFKAMNLPPFGPGAMLFFVAWGFVQGIVSVWLYAAMRRHYGAGVRTAIRAGLTVWILAYAFPSLGSAFTGMSPWGLVAAGLGWSLVEAPVAAVLGAWVYRD